MIRNIIQIDESKCNGCGLCVSACHEGAIQLVDGKAKLMREDYCDGLGNCLPACPTGAITIEEREAEMFKDPTKTQTPAPEPMHQGGCPGTRMRAFEPVTQPEATEETSHSIPSQLRQWPCQIQLVPPNAPYFKDANLLIAADCAAYAYGEFHTRFMKNKITVIGCPKLDDVDYSEKLTAILTANSIKSVTIVRMEVPCCGGLANAAIEALQACGKMIPWSIVTIGVDGRIVE